MVPIWEQTGISLAPVWFSHGTREVLTCTSLVSSWYKHHGSLLVQACEASKSSSNTEVSMSGKLVHWKPNVCNDRIYSCHVSESFNLIFVQSGSERGRGGRGAGKREDTFCT